MIPMQFSREAAQARAEGRPIVALESTIITHGMPFPSNLDMVTQVEDDIRQAGVCPATIAVLDGTIKIGLDAAELDAFAQVRNARKLSRADLAACLAARTPGATTVAATMICARLAGIDVFATGGIGGVHRGAEHSLDISADLQELVQTPVNVICAGAKAILDLPKTWEYLETLGVPVIAYGQESLPAFWSRTSSNIANLRMHSPDEIAEAFRMRQTLGIKGGQLIANPIPKDQEIPQDIIGPWIDAALEEAAVAGVRGKAVTPFLLDRIVHLSDGQSLRSNIALVRNNARLAAQIALSLRKFT